MGARLAQIEQNSAEQQRTDAAIAGVAAASTEQQLHEARQSAARAEEAAAALGQKFEWLRAQHEKAVRHTALLRPPAARPASRGALPDSVGQNVQRPYPRCCARCS